jgi:hypothetical protein
MPAYYHDLYFGMHKTAFEELRPNAKLMESQQTEFRYTYLQKGGGKDVFETVYYVDNDEDKPVLYEMILEYYNTTARDKAAKELLGSPNYGEENNEWMFQTEEEFRIHCWTHLNKLVIVGKLPGTEWEETPE